MTRAGDGFDPVPGASGADDMDSPYSRFIERWRAKGGKPVKAGKNVVGQCPAHDDHDPSLSVSKGEDGRVLVKCFSGCDTEAICGVLDLEVRELFPRRNRKSTRARDTKAEPPASEIMTEEDPDPLWTDDELDQAARRLASSPDRDRLIAERCWDAETVERYGLGLDTDGRVIIPIRDLAGELVQVERYAALTHASPKILAVKNRPRALLLPPGAMPSEVYVTEGFSDCLAAVSNGVPAVAAPSAAWKDRHAATLAEAGVRVAHVVSDCDEAGRKFAAEAVASLTARGIEARAIDLGADRPEKFDLTDLVREHGAATSLMLTMLVKQTPSRLDVLRRDAGSLLDETVSFLRRYVWLPDPAQYVALALWIAHTHALDAATVTPYLSVSSPERGCGKSVLMETLGSLVRAPWHTVSTSEAALFRRIELDRPTLLLDEADAIFGSASERTEPLRAVLNGGNRAGASVTRVVGPDLEVRDFSTFCAKALAGIETGKLPDTIRDRSISIAMRRIGPDEKVERVTGARRRKVEKAAAELRDRWATWAEAVLEPLRAIEPDDLAELSPRAFDGWEPLLAIGELAGDEWRNRARDAALKLSGGAAAEQRTTGTTLLAALRGIFADRPRMKSEDICGRLNGDETLPYGRWNDGRGITPIELARHLRPYGITPRDIRFSDGARKGYRRDDFADAWRRYVADTDPRHNPKPRHEKPDEHGDVAAVAAVAALPDTPGTAPQTSPPVPDIRDWLRHDRRSA